MIDIKNSITFIKFHNSITFTEFEIHNRAQQGDVKQEGPMDTILS